MYAFSLFFLHFTWLFQIDLRLETYSPVVWLPFNKNVCPCVCVCSRVALLPISTMKMCNMRECVKLLSWRKLCRSRLNNKDLLQLSIESIANASYCRRVRGYWVENAILIYNRSTYSISMDVPSAVEWTMPKMSDRSRYMYFAIRIALNQPNFSYVYDGRFLCAIICATGSSSDDISLHCSILCTFDLNSRSQQNTSLLQNINTILNIEMSRIIEWWWIHLLSIKTRCKSVIMYWSTDRTMLFCSYLNRKKCLECMLPRKIKHKICQTRIYSHLFGVSHTVITEQDTCVHSLSSAVHTAYW